MITITVTLFLFSVNGTLKQRVCPKGTSTCADALVSFSDANGAKIRLSAKFCARGGGGGTGGGGGGNDDGAEASGVDRNDDEGDEVDKFSADDFGTSSSSSTSSPSLSSAVAEETKGDASTSGTANSNGASDVVNDAASDSGGAYVNSKLDFCDGINATATLKGWSDVSCVETKCASDLCNGLECYQPQRNCIANLTKTGKPTLRDVAGCTGDSLTKR